MTEYDLICRMLRDRYRLQPEDDGSFLLVERKEASGHKEHIVKSNRILPVREMAVFRFSLDDEDFLPFFSDSRSPECGPRLLKKFCDYIMLAHDGGSLHILLIELKRSPKDAEIPHQLGASEFFMRYVVSSAQRIGRDNGCADFDESKITFRKVCIKKDPTGHKLGIRPKEKFRQTAEDDIVTLHLASNFNPLWTF